MVQYSNFDRIMEDRDHFKNETSSKVRVSSINSIITQTIAFFFVICFLSMCKSDKFCDCCCISWIWKSIVQFKSPVEYQLNNNGTELDVILDIESGFTDNAYLMLHIEKNYSAISL